MNFKEEARDRGLDALVTEATQVLLGVTRLIRHSHSDERGLQGDNMAEYENVWEPRVKRVLEDLAGAMADFAREG